MLIETPVKWLMLKLHERKETSKVGVVTTMHFSYSRGWKDMERGKYPNGNFSDGK